MQEVTQSSPGFRLSEVAEYPPKAIVIKGILLVSAMLISHIGTTIAYYAMPNDRSQSDERWCIEEHIDDDRDGDEGDSHETPYTHCHEGDKEHAYDKYVSIVLLIQFMMVMPHIFMCLSCCVERKYKLLGYAPIIILTMAMTFIMGRAFVTSREVTVIVSLIGCGLMIFGNVVFIFILSFKSFLKPAIPRREWNQVIYHRCNKTNTKFRVNL